MATQFGWAKSTYSGNSFSCVEVGGWRKSTKSESGHCVEVSGMPRKVLVRDTTDRQGPVLTFDGIIWGQFVQSVAQRSTQG